MKRAILLVLAAAALSTCAASGQVAPGISGSNEDILTFLGRTAPPRGMALGQWHAHVNRLMQGITFRDPPPPGLTDVLIGLVSKNDQDPVVRSYAIQHLTLTWYRRASAADRERIRDALRQSTTQPNGATAATALLAMERLREEVDAFSAEETGRAALRIVGNAGFSDMTRAAALHVAAKATPAAARDEAARLRRDRRDGLLTSAADAVLGVAEAPVSRKPPCPDCPQEKHSQ